MYRRLIWILAFAIAGLAAVPQAGAIDVTVESGACDSNVSRQQVANAGVTRISAFVVANGSGIG